MDLCRFFQTFTPAQQPTNLREFVAPSVTPPVYSAGSRKHTIADAVLGTGRYHTHQRQRVCSAKATSTQRSSPFSTLLDWGQQGATKLSRGLQPFPAGFPAGPSGDQALQLLADPLGYLDRITQQYGPVVGLVLGGEYVVVVADVAAARTVLQDQTGLFVKEGTAFLPGSSLAGNGLLVSDGPVWRRQRQLSNPAFRTAAVQAYAKAMAASAQRLVSETWQGSRERDVYADFNALSLQITMEALFGVDLPPREGRQVTEAVKAAFDYFSQRGASSMVVPEWVPTPVNVQFNAAIITLNRLVYGMISQRRMQLRQQPHPPVCLLEELITATDERGQGMEDEALRDELMTLLIAGQETAAIALTWTCAYLAHNPAAQDSIAAEVQQHLHGQPPSYSNIRGLVGVESALLEGMRLKPPAFIVGRCVSRPTELASCRLPAGTTILVSPYILHRLPGRWRDAAAFQPDRWHHQLQESSGAMGLLPKLAATGAYLPFGAGPRSCIGTGFAMMEASIILAAILQRYQLKPSRVQPSFPTADPQITLRPQEIVTLSVESRP
ncbi:hypothetical protein WJX74_005464 [Apatococcus lobatus]|uniref:Cytochrome P450 n=1 Tax=Apatococcus lobatus TaxID=904363 RepID=A0AAW1RAN5_9CHLO